MDKIAAELVKGKHCSFMIDLNESHHMNYMTAKEWIDDHPENYPLDEFPFGAEDRSKAIEENSVWTIYWNPNTQGGSCVMRASSFDKLYFLMKTEAGLA